MYDAPVLFLDDNRLSNLHCCEFLRDHGVDVIEVHCAANALKVIDAHVPLSALVTDIQHGDDADGYQIARCARTVHPHLAVVFISGTSADRHAAEGVKGSEFISKPFEGQQLIEALDHAVYLEAA